MKGWESVIRLMSRMTAFQGRRRSGEEPRRVFTKFLRVLNSNNRALELIADIGEKMSGEYVFDRRYIEETISGLSDIVRGSVDALIDLDPGQKDLVAVYRRLTDHLEAVMAGEEDRQGPRVIALAAVEPLQWTIVGSKNARLSEVLSHLDIDVPPGFSITTRTYHDLIDHNGLRSRVDVFEKLWTGGEGEVAGLEEVRQELETAILGALPPPGFMEDLADAIGQLVGGRPEPVRLAVRSSAREEDLDFSFAGQFETVLNVPSDSEAVFRAWLKVVSSLFNRQAVEYRRRLFPDEGRTSMACSCQLMVDAEVSGVAYSTDPGNPGGDGTIIVGAWGQGAGVVEGGIPADTFLVSRRPPHSILERQIAVKKTGFYMASGGGLEERPLSDEKIRRPCLSDSQLQELGRRALQLEHYFKRPQDIEWAFDGQGRLVILQARPLVMGGVGDGTRVLPEDLSHYERLTADRGRVAQQGIGAGPVHIVRTADDLASFPDGAVLVGSRDSSRFVRVMHRAAAIVTEVGTPVSHMSTLCRELRVPCIVDLPGIIDAVENGEEITVDAEDRSIYRGRVAELLAYRLSTSTSFSVTQEFRMLRRLLNSVSLLNLVDPLFDDFAPENCLTYHDLLRYIHETAVRVLVDVGKDDRNLIEHNIAHRLELSVPAGIMAIDIGGGLKSPSSRRPLSIDDVTSLPFRAILQGMLTPGVWHRGAMPVGIRDLMSSMLSAPPDVLDGQYTGHNVAVVAKNYVNLCFRFGYHFNIIDAYCGEVERENHIYFRFLGGATDMTKRSRRARLIAEILKSLEFTVRTRGDLVIARAGNMALKEMEQTLDALGRLVGFTRQLDVRLDSEDVLGHYVQAFLREDYGIVNA